MRAQVTRKTWKVNPKLKGVWDLAQKLQTVANNLLTSKFPA